MPAPVTSPSRTVRRMILVASVAVGIACVFLVPPPLYFQFGRFTAGLPQQYFAFDPDRYLAGVPQRSGALIAAIAAAKFATGFIAIWLVYAIIRFVRRGDRQITSSSL